MIPAELSFDGPGRRAFLIGVTFVIFVAMSLSMMQFLADRYFAAAAALVDDPMTEELDMIDVSDSSLSSYLKAIGALEKAAMLAPMDSEYARSLGDLYFRVAEWQETMLALGVGDRGRLSGVENPRAAAFWNVSRAASLDPANADHHLALGRLYAVSGMRDEALGELNRATQAYPINSTVRYSAAMQMLMIGLDRQAGEQARMIAQCDDSYRLDEDDPGTSQKRERRLPEYIHMLSNSYLYKAMEIVWRTSGRDSRAVLAIVPDNVDAREVGRLFSDAKALPIDSVH